MASRIIRKASLFTGIASDCVAAPRWKDVSFCEIDKFACSLLRHRYPGVPNLGDVRGVDRVDCDVLVFGSPCQDVSTQGKRKGFFNDGVATRSGLFHEAARIIRASEPKWFVMENVQGLLSANKGESFADVITGLTGRKVDADKWTSAGIAVGKEYSIAWRVLDGRFFGTPQPRKRLFVVGFRGDVEAPASVLFKKINTKLVGDRKHEKRRFFLFHRYGELAVGIGTCMAQESTFKRSFVWDEFGPRSYTPREYESLMGFPLDYTLIPNYRKPIRITKSFIERCREFGVDVDEEYEAVANYYGTTTDDLHKFGVTPMGVRMKALGNSIIPECLRFIFDGIEERS